MKEEDVKNSIQTPTNILEPFKVYVRIRPFLSKEILKLKRNNSTSLLVVGNNNQNNYNYINVQSIFGVDRQTLYVYDNKYHKKERKYFFNNIFTENNNNKDVFDISIKPIIKNVINGYNSTALAYGVTGTGKTHTIFGDLSVQNGEEGIAIKACDYLFRKLSSQYFEDEFIIKVSYIEIYNENVIDLLNNETNSGSLMIIEDPNKGVYCPNVKEFIINNSLELKKIICQGNKRRTMAPTNQNKFSSRSHAILQISLERKTFNEKNNNFDIYFSKFLMVDLAGSERGGLEKGKRREEGANINKSLFTLGSCINILSDKNKSGKFIPYRDSKLTRLLKDSLGGNILTVMLVCVSPSNESYEESISSLNYAARAKKIKKKVYQNKKEVCFLDGNNTNFRNINNNNQYEEIIGSLKNEIYQLKNIIKDQQDKLMNNYKNKVINSNQNDTLNLEDDTILKMRQNSNNPNSNEKIFFGETSDISSIQMNNTYINQNLDINNNNNFINNSLIQAVNEIDVEKYNIFFEEIKEKDIDIDSLKKQIENIKSDKNNLEIFLEQSQIHKLNSDNIINDVNINYDNLEKKYIVIKKYYDKFLEIINDKLVENIEQNMILKCNIKEISALNRNNIDYLESLNIQSENYKKNINENCDEHDCEYDKMNEKIKNIKNTIKENLMIKNEILKTYNENMNKKTVLKKILLSLLDDKKENSNKLMNILKDKEKLIEMNKEFKKKIEKYLKIQKKKDNDINLVQRQVEVLRAQLKEKEEKILELKKHNNSNSNNNNNYDNNTYNNNYSKRNNSKSNINNNMNLYYIKKNNNELINYVNKGKRSISCIRNYNNMNNLMNINNNNCNKLIKNDIRKNDKHQTYVYCYNASNDDNVITNDNINNLNNMNLRPKIVSFKDKNRNEEYIKRSNHRSKSEKIRQDQYINDNNCNDDNNNLFKKIIFNKNSNIDKIEKIGENTINVIEDENGIKKIRITQEYLLNDENVNVNNINNININNSRKYYNESNKKINDKNFNELLMKYKIYKNNNINNNENNNNNNIIIKKGNSKAAYDCTRNNKKNINLSQKRFEKFMNNHLYNNSQNNNKEDSDQITNISKRLNRQINKKMSLNEARYEKKIKNEKAEKKRDLSVEYNHANAECFINSFKGMNLKQNNNNNNIYIKEYLENDSKNNNILTKESQNLSNININDNLNKNKNCSFNNQNTTVCLDGNYQVETKGNDSTNFKTDQSKILKTEDLYLDLVNSIKNAPLNKYKQIK